MVVARVGVAAVAVVAPARQRLLVVPLDRAHPAFLEQAPDLLRTGPEGTQVAQAVERLDAARAGVFQQGAECDVVAVDTAEDRDARERTLDLDAVGRAVEKPDALGPATAFVQQSTGRRDGFPEALERHQLLTPGGEAAVFDQVRRGVSGGLGGSAGRDPLGSLRSLGAGAGRFSRGVSGVFHVRQLTP